jgi:DNA adenine methylase
VKNILGLAPSYLRYIEPFVGGGAVLYAAAVPGSIAADVYAPLIALWKLVQSEPKRVIDNYRIQWQAVNAELDMCELSSPDTLVPKYYYAVRERFNATHDPLDLNFIMRTCVNGIVRFNDRGDFNNSFHLSRRGMLPATFEKIVCKWTKVIQGVEFRCQDFEVTLSEAKKGDFIYMDPPYAGNKQRYIADLDVEKLFRCLEDLNRRDVRWALSFDGYRGDKDLTYDVPTDLFKRCEVLPNGLSAVRRVLSGVNEEVKESLYLNY